MVRPQVGKPAFFTLAAAFFHNRYNSPLNGQTLKGTILGTITDSTQAVIPNVRVNLTETNTNFQRTETTNDSGFFAFAELDPGMYRVEVEQTGFRKMVRSDVPLDANSTVRVDLELQPGQQTEVIEVTANANILQTDRADTGATIENGQFDYPALAQQPELPKHADDRAGRPADVPLQFAVFQLAGALAIGGERPRREE